MAASMSTDILTASLGRSIALAYGRHLVGGNMILKEESDPNKTIAFLALGEGEWDAIEALWINGAPVDVTLPGRFHFHKGLDGQLSSDGGLLPEGVGSLYPFDADGDQKADALTPAGVQGLTFSRTAYLALAIPFDVFAPTPELTVLGQFRCRKVRFFNEAGVQTGYGWTDNPAWQIADLLTAVRGLPDSRLDWASFKAAADYCDQLIPINGQNVRRFVCNVAFTEEVDFDQALEAILATCRGHLLDTEGTIKLRVDQPRSSVLDFTDHPVQGVAPNIVEGSFRAFYQDTREVSNRLELLFRDPDNEFQVITKFWNHEPQQARTGRVILAKLHLGNLPQHQAERIGNYLLTRAIDNNLHVRLRGTPATLAVMPGDVVRVKHDAAPWGQQAAGNELWKSFEVLEVAENPDETRDFLLRVYNPVTYTDVAGPAQNLIGTTVYRRPPVPAAPPLWGLTANLAGELRLRFAIPEKTDYRVGDLTLLADEELNRTTTSLAVPMGATDEQMNVASSAGFLVGDFVNVGTEILEIVGPGTVGAQPSANVWEVGRGRKGTTASAAAMGSTVYRLTPQRLHFALPPGYTLAHPTLDLANGEYYRMTFRPGRLRILHAALEFTNLGGKSEAVETTYAVVGAFEPNVPGTLPGLRSGAGGKVLVQVPGPLATGSDLAQGVYLPEGVSIGLVYATVEKASTGAAIRLQLKLDGQPFGPVAEIPAGEAGLPSGSGVFASGAIEGNAGGRRLEVEVLQVGSGEPGEDLTVHVTL